MTDLKVRRVRFDLAGDDIPFLWQPERPSFSVVTNYMSFLAPGFEKLIVDATREAIPLMTDPDAVEEANLYLRQEAQHASAHMRHIKALIRRYPGLQDTVDELFASYDRLTATKPLMWRLAYTAVLESTFTPYFKVYLDHEDKLFASGDERVGSLLLWHFSEEIEHRASAMIVYNAVNDSFRYRLRAMGSVIKHISETVAIVSNGFQQHVPPEDGGHFGAVLPNGFSFKGFRDAKRMVKELMNPDQATYQGVPRRELVAMVIGLIRAQSPNHNAQAEKTPSFAWRLLERYETDPTSLARWYSQKAHAADVSPV
ncbi:metal-dependent hydrolase [Mycobacterium sp. 94-17]|uniref:metal-dependent hydrolase n=1 Tax=Mycobacterium sp. 94-17 TaxID=2986147 RepID=UPI002D1F026D|nr:metal-dependent hydrolase [Mycobacterium sp. 94-17]MEB4207732.1 metal-dependent hydrolase [Mycobacterium sp. 94-17]